MGRTISPLRYPGGKGCLLDLTATLLKSNDLNCAHYAEPFAGGCGLALALLFTGAVAEIHINDLDPAIWAFWHAALDDTEQLISLIETTPLTIEEWHRQRDVLRAGPSGPTLDLAFATFFLNRTNRSGIIAGGGVIGGLDQKGPYKIDCRFNRADLIRRLRRIARYRSQIHLTNLDAIAFLERSLPKRSLLFIDPPYFCKGPGLYTSYYKAEDHARLAHKVLKITTPWIVTYDDVPEIRTLYAPRRQFLFDIKYSLQSKRVGSELLVASSNLSVPDSFRPHAIDPLPEAA